jgi:hypothetical protein
MRRKTFDALLTAGGLLIAVVLVVAGALLTWAHNFTSDQVKTQLASQQIFFPAAGSSALTASPEIQKYVTPYAGQQVLNGQQAEVFADHYIAVHLSEMTDGGVYAKLSADSRANPNDTKLAATVDTSFKGTTLRGMLLNAYAFWKMGQIAGIAAIASFIGAGVLLVLAGLGFWHLRKVDPAVEVLPKLGARAPAPVEP